MPFCYLYWSRKEEKVEDVIRSIERQYSLNSGTERDKNVLHFYDTADSYTEYVIMDDNRIPYQPVKIVPKLLKMIKELERKTSTAWMTRLLLALQHRFIRGWSLMQSRRSPYV